MTGNKTMKVSTKIVSLILNFINDSSKRKAIAKMPNS